MSGITATLADLLGALNQSFRLSAFFPAALFVAANAVLAKQYLASLYQEIAALEIGGFALAFSLALAISYSLSILNGPLTQLYEGYTFRHTLLGKLLTMYNLKKIRWLADQVREKGDLKLQAQMEQATINNELMNSYPVEAKAILPTRLGNVLAAFEDYPRHSYAIESIALWPRLVPILIKSGYAEIVERQKMGFDFFLNLSFLSIVYALEYSAVSMHMSARLVVLIPAMYLLLAWVFYRFAILAAYGFGTTVKVAFDLYRDALREAIGLENPTNFGREKGMWEQYSNFVLAIDRRKPISVFIYPRPTPGKPEPKKLSTDKAAFE